jgi:hypothetical protein
MNEIKNEIKRLWDSGVAIETIIRSLPTTGVLARNTIEEMRLNGELKPRNKHEATRLKIGILREKGYNPYEIANELSISKRTVIECFGELGIKGRPPHNHNQRKRNEKANAIIEELKKGNNQFSEIAREYGVSRQYVFQLHKEQKLKEI